jgi:hypothetical protein
MGGVEGEKGRHMSLGGQKGGGVMKYGLNPIANLLTEITFII